MDWAVSSITSAFGGGVIQKALPYTPQNCSTKKDVSHLLRFEISHVVDNTIFIDFRKLSSLQSSGLLPEKMVSGEKLNM
jgi:hypothetical protein